MIGAEDDGGMDALRGGAAIADLSALVDHLARCLAFADARGDFVLAALISAAYETAVTRLGPAAGEG